MSFKRRLSRLENQPSRFTVRKDGSCPEIERKILKQLALPLPEFASEEEKSECLRLLFDAQARLRIDQVDKGGFDAVRDYALSLHSKYATKPFYGYPPGQ
jgi:hypothetical protein